MNQTTKGFKAQQLTKTEMKQLKGGAGVGPLPYNWSCQPDPLICGWVKADCVAQCPGKCIQVRNCL